MQPDLHQRTAQRVCSAGLIAFLALPGLRAAGFAQSAKATRASEVATRLDTLKETIAKEVTVQLERTNFSSSYTTVWRQFEDVAIDALEKILPRHIPELAAKNFDTGTEGREKNRLADFAIVVAGETIEISIKTARG